MLCRCLSLYCRFWTRYFFRKSSSQNNTFFDLSLQLLIYQLLNCNFQQGACCLIQSFDCKDHPCMISTNTYTCFSEQHYFYCHIFGSALWFHPASWMVCLVAGFYSFISWIVKEFVSVNSFFSSQLNIFLGGFRKMIAECRNNIFDAVNITRVGELESFCQGTWHCLINFILPMASYTIICSLSVA